MILENLYVFDILNTPPSTPAIGDAYIIGDSATGDWAGHERNVTEFTAGGWDFALPFNGLQAFVGSTNSFRVYEDAAWAAVGSTDFATKSGVETLSNKTISGAFQIATNGARVGITNDSTPISPLPALLAVHNKTGETSNTLNTRGYWTGTTAAPYQNNDCILTEVYNDVQSDSLNRSWALSAPNGYNNIPAGVTDTGSRVGVIGWAVSVARAGYVHEGILASQIGVQGNCGFQGSGSGASAIIQDAIGVRGEVYNDSAGSTIQNARAGSFHSSPSIGTVQNNYAVYALAQNGTALNYSFYGAAGKFHNQGDAFIGGLLSMATAASTQSSPAIAARKAGDSYEFGHPDAGGYGSNIGATYSSGWPFIALCAEADPTGNTFATRGKLGTTIHNNLAGAMIFSRLTNANASGQSLTESARFDADGHLHLAATPYLSTKTPSSPTATGKTGEIGWDVNYLYICVATNTWKRVALSSWTTLAESSEAPIARLSTKKRKASTKSTAKSKKTTPAQSRKRRAHAKKSATSRTE